MIRPTNGTDRLTMKPLLTLIAPILIASAGFSHAGERLATPSSPLIGASVSAPVGFLDFCRRSPEDCREPGAAETTLSDIRSRATALFWAEAFGRPVLEPASTSSRTTSIRDLEGPHAASATDSGVPAVEGAGLFVSAASSGEWAIAAQTLARGVAARTAASRKAPILDLSKDDWKLVERLNKKVNREIRRGSDLRNYGRPDFWTVPEPGGRGDCEDYVLAKRRALVQAGFNPGALSIAIADTRWGESHAVLLLTTKQGVYVLDSLTSRIVSWERAPYQWRSRQLPGRVFDWVSMTG